MAQMNRLDWLRGRTDMMVQALESIVMLESPSSDVEANTKCAHVIADVGKDLLGKWPEVMQLDGKTHLYWSLGEPKVMLLGHFDTVWPLGTTARWPFRVDGERATGPGAFDMKGGIVQGLFALASLEDPTGVSVLLTSDEEIGSRSSRGFIEKQAKVLDAVLVLEPSRDRALKVARKGGGGYGIEVTGKAAHSGLEPEKGINAMIELAHQVLALENIADNEAGTSVVPTFASAGTTRNTVPAFAKVWVDVRAKTVEEQHRVDKEIRELVAVTPGASLKITDGPERPPMPEELAKALFEKADKVAEGLGLGHMEAVSVGGGSDGNLTAAMGTPTLDGLGAVGDGAHAEGEHVIVPAMPERAALLAGLIEEIL